MPEPVIFFLVLVVLPVVLISWLARRHHRSKLDAILHTVFTGLFVVFLFSWGQYAYTGSYYLRYVLVAAFLLALFLCFRKAKRLPVIQKAGLLNMVLLGIFIVFSFLFGALDIFAIKAHFVNKPTLNLSFPLKGGTYYISTGGSNARQTHRSDCATIPYHQHSGVRVA